MASAALVLFSAGQDSATCLAWALGRFDRVETIGFDYGQRHAIELTQRPVLRESIAGLNQVWSERLGADLVVDLRGYGELAESALTSDRAFEMSESGLPSTFVPGRNLVFLTVAGAQAYRRGIDVLVGGMCETDYAGYPDCRQEALDAQMRALALGLARAISLATPLMRLTKAETWAMAEDVGGPALTEAIIEHSHTCYQGDRAHRHAWGYGCGVCPACDLRERGFKIWKAHHA